IPVAGLGPAIHVFGAAVVAASRRGCPGRARARGFGRHELPFNFPGQPCACGERGLSMLSQRSEFYAALRLSRPILISRLPVNKFLWGNSLLTQWPMASAPDDRQRIDRARQVAEELFKPRQQTISANEAPSATDAASSAEPQPRRQPRVFAIPPQMPTRAAEATAPAQ